MQGAVVIYAVPCSIFDATCCVLQGGDLMAAIAKDAQNKLRWSRKGHTLALGIARGLVHLHANKVCSCEGVEQCSPCQ